MIFHTTDAGIQAAIDFGLGGPAVNLNSFNVGSAYGYTLPPAALPSNTPNGTSATAITGALSLTNFPITGSRKVAPDTIEYTLRLNSDVGTFDFGNVGIYMSTGQLFAIAVLDSPVHKEIFGPGTAGNVIEFIVRMTFGGASVVIEYVINPIVNANLLEVSSVDLLPTPTAADTNVYLVNGLPTNPIGLTDNGDSFLAYKKDTNYWSFDGYAMKVYSGTVATSTSTSLTDAGIPNLIYAAGRFLIQFTSGAHIGVVRAVNATAVGSVGWYTSTGAAVAAGTTFDIICSDIYALSLNNVEELASVNSIPLVASNDKRTYRVTRNRTVAGSGTLTFDCTNTFATTSVQEWMPSDHGLVFDVGGLPTVSSGAGNPSGWVNDSTHVIMATPMLVPTSVYSSLPGSHAELVMTFFSGDNAGYISEVTAVTAVDDGVTQWIKFTLGRALPASANIGAKFKLFYPNIVGGSAVSGGASGGQFKVESYTAGVGGQTNWTTSTINAYFALVFWGSTFQDPTTYTINSASNITTSFNVPEGEKLHFVEITAAPIPGAGIDVGIIVPFPKSTSIPAGYLVCNGQQVPQASYPDLYAYLGTTYNTGGESPGYFRVPDYRAVFLRGLDLGRGLDAGRIEATYQNDALQNITGSIDFGFNVNLGTATGALGKTNIGLRATTPATGGYTTQANTITFNAATSAGARTAGETRPINMVVVYCIRAYSSLVNGGVADVAAIQTQVTDIATRVTNVDLWNTPVALGSISNGVIQPTRSTNVTAISGSRNNTTNVVSVTLTFTGTPTLTANNYTMTVSNRDYAAVRGVFVSDVAFVSATQLRVDFRYTDNALDGQPWQDDAYFEFVLYVKP